MGLFLLLIPAIRQKAILFSVLVLLGLCACQKKKGCTDPEAFNYDGSAEKDDGSCFYRLKVRFQHKVGNKELRFNDRDYKNAAGASYRIIRLRYLISDLVLHRSGKPDIRTDGHHLVWIAPNNTIEYGNDASNPSFTWKPSSAVVPEGKYSGLSFNFGFNSEDNGSGSYSGLNQANWAWPEMLGGGYHFLQFEGEYDSAGAATPVFNMHMGTARDTSGANTVYVNNHFRVEWNKGFTIDGDDRSIELVMDLAKWFTPPPDPMGNGNGAVWELEKRPKAVMPHYDSQRTLNSNGRDVFSFDP